MKNINQCISNTIIIIERKKNHQVISNATFLQIIKKMK